jgi:hypothetical protein
VGFNPGRWPTDQVHLTGRIAIIGDRQRREAKGTPMTTIEVFDPATSGAAAVEASRADPRCAGFDADLRWFAAQGVSVARYSLTGQRGEFMARPVVAALLRCCGEGLLPIVLVDGKFCFGGTWPPRADLIRSCQTSRALSTL